MSELRQEIAEHFALSNIGMRKLSCFEGEYTTYTVKQDGYYGVAILNKYKKEIQESFHNAEISNIKIEQENGSVQEYILLSSNKHAEKLKFSHICEDFVKLGKDNLYREKILADPYLWWKEWGTLIGDTKSYKSPYDVLAELWIFLCELEDGNKSISWEGSSKKNHDLESEQYNIEVKSTVAQFKEEVTISNNFQLNHNNTLFLDFVILQENIDGISIDDIVSRIVGTGLDIDEIEEKLSNLSLPKSSRSRRVKYKILEVRRYSVDDEFPQINASSFINAKVPLGIKKISYVVSLDKIDYVQQRCF